MIFYVIRSEIFKFCVGKLLYILLTIGVLYIILQQIPLLEMLYNLLEMEEADQSQPLIFGYQAFRHTHIDGLFMFFMPALIVKFFTSEYTKKTIYPVVEISRNRTILFLGKYIALFLTVIFLLFSFAAFSTLLATVINGWGTDVFLLELGGILLLVLKMSFFQLSLAGMTLMVGFIAKQESWVILSYFAISLLESIIASILVNLGSANQFLGTMSNLFPTVYAFSFLEGSDVLHQSNSSWAWFSIFLMIITTITMCTCIFNKQDLV